MREIRTSGSMSGDGKRSIAAWPKLPRPSSILPPRRFAAVRRFGRDQSEADMPRASEAGRSDENDPKPPSVARRFCNAPKPSARSKSLATAIGKSWRRMISVWRAQKPDEGAGAVEQMADAQVLVE